MLQRFREQHLVWDKANRRIHERVEANASDAKGRKLVVQVLNDGVIEDLAGTSLSLYWETRNEKNKGLDAFDVVDAEQGRFELYYTTGMLSNEGKLRANLVLVDDLGKVVSEEFSISVSRGIDEEAAESSDSFTALTQALVKVNRWESDFQENYDAWNSQYEQNYDEWDSKHQENHDKWDKTFEGKYTQLEEEYATNLNELKQSDENITAQLAQTAILVDSFGAVGDGEADDTLKIRDALVYAKNNGYQKVKFDPTKTYRVSDRIPISFSNIEVDVQGATIIYENDKNVNPYTQYWQSVFHAVGEEDDSTKTAITGYKTINDGTGGQGNLVKRGRWTVNDASAFKENDYVFIDVPLDQTIKDYSEARPACQMATKVISVGTGYIDTEYYTPFDWTKRVWHGTESLWKIQPLENVTIKNINFIDNNPQVKRTIFEEDTTVNRQKQLSVVGGKYVVNFNVENINVKNNHQQGVITYGCIGVSVKNIDVNEPKYLGSGQGYAVQFKHSYNIVAERIKGYKIRHLVDFTASAFATVLQSYSSHEYNYAFDVHGFCEHDITFKDCTGSLQISNSVQYFPNLVKNIAFENCDFNSAFINWGENLVFRDSRIVFMGINAVADIIILDVGNITFDNCMLEVVNKTRFLGRKRTLDIDTSVKLIDTKIKGYEDGNEDVNGGIFAQTLDLFEVRSSYIDLSDLNAHIEVRDVGEFISRDNIYKNAFTFIQGDANQIWNLDYDSSGDTYDIDDNCKRMNLSGNKAPLHWAGARNRVGRISVQNITFKLRSDSQVIDFVDLPDGGSGLTNSKLFVDYDNVYVEILGSANVRANIGQYADIIFNLKNWKYRSRGSGNLTYGGKFNLKTSQEINESLPLVASQVPSGLYNDPKNGQIIWNSNTSTGQPIGWIWNGTAFKDLPLIP